MKIRRNPVTGLEQRVKRGVSVAMLQWAQSTISDASAHAPILTGQLRRSITHSQVYPTAEGFKVVVGPDVTVKAYAERQELDMSLGFGRLSRAEGATRPWLRPAFAHHVDLGKALVRAAFRRAIRQ